jgi:flagellar protein FliO/FliZ
MEPTSLELFRLIASLVLVFGLLGGLLWALKKMQTRLQGAGPNRKMALIESLSLAPRQKIALIQIGEQQLVVGITPTSITPLMKVAADGAVQIPAQAPSPTAFKEELQRV